MKIYLAHSLTHASEEFKQLMLELRDKLKGKHEVLEFFSLSRMGTADPREVYQHDISCVQACDLVLAEVSHPSTGLGIEIATALNLGKKVLAVATAEAKVSRMVLGMTHGNYKFIRYRQPMEILDYL